MEKFYSKKAKEASFIISVLINVLIVFFCIKLLNVFHFVKKPLEVVLLANNDIEKNYTNVNLPEKKIQTNINQKILPNIVNNSNIAKANQKEAKKPLQPQIISPNKIKTQDNNQLDISKNTTSESTIDQFSQTNQSIPQQNLQAETKNENIVQTQNDIQNIQEADYAFLRKLIEKHLTYPYFARRNGYEGTVVVSFIIQDSKIKNISIVKSSRYSVLDKSAVDAIKKIEPLINIRKYVKVVIPINFRLSNS
jgi:protein TonB